MKSEFVSDAKSNFRKESEKVRGFTYYDYKIRPHIHDFYEINIIISGKGTHIIGNNMVDTKKGDVFVIPPSVVHSYINTQNMNVFHILIKTEIVEGIKSLNLVNGFNLLFEIEPLLRSNMSKDLLLHLSNEQLELLQNDLICISDEIGKNYPNSEEFKNCTAEKIICWLSYFLYEQASGETSSIREDVEYSMVKIIDYIYANFSKNITIEELCNIVNMSKPTLYRNFKSYCGCTPMEFIRKHRKKEALSLLSKGM